MNSTMKNKSTLRTTALHRLSKTARVLASCIVAQLALAAPAAFADTISSSVALRIGSIIAPDTGTLSLYNDGGGNVQRTFLNFNLGSYSGNSVTSDATMTLVAGIFGNFLTGVSLGTANSVWTQAGITWNNQPSITAIADATNPSGTFGSGNVTWTIPWYMLEKMATAGSGYNNGLGITSGAGSSQHFESNTSNGGQFPPTLTFSAATGASSTWNGGNGNWTDTANWAGSTVTQGINQAATINGGTAVNITMDANRSVGSLSFSGANHTISSGAGKLALNVTTGSPTISVETGRIATIGATVVGLDGLTKTSAGTLTLTGANTYTGATTLSAGTLSVGADNNLGAATNGITFSGGTLQVTGTALTSFGSHAVTFTSGASVGLDINNAANNFAVSQAITSGAGGLTKLGSGTLTLSGANTYTGSTTVNGGGLTLTPGGSIAAASNIQVNSGTLAISSRTLANNMVLNGGAVMVQASEDNVGTGGTITLSGGNVIHTFTASGTLVLPISVGSVSELIVGAGGGGGAGVYFNVYNAGGGGGKVLNLTGQALASGTTAVVVGAGGAGGDNASGTAGGASSIGGNTAAGGSGANDNNGTGGTSGSGMAGGVRNGSASGGGGGDSAAGATAANGSAGGNGGAGTVGTITGSFYGGGGGGSSQGTQGAGGVGGGGSGSSSNVGTTGTVNTGGGGGSGAAGGSGIAIVQYAYAAAGFGVVTLNGTVDLQSASTLDAAASGGLLDVTGLISTSTGSGGLTIASSNTSGGVVRFSSANTYVGNTTVNTGATLRMNTTNALPSGSGKGNLSLSGTLDLNAQATTSLNGLSGSGTIDNQTGAGTYALSVGSNDQTSTFDGVIKNTTGTLNLTKTGTGTQTLTGANTYSGTTTVNGGKLIVNGSISGSTTVNNGGTLGGGGTTGAVTVASGGTLAPGNSTGILSVASFNQNSGAHLAMQIGGTVAGFNTNGSDGYDRLIVNSTLSIAGNLDGTLLNGYLPTSATYNTGTNQLNLDGTTFYLVIGASSLSGTFANQQAPESLLTGFNTITFGGQEFAISYTANYNGGVNSSFSSGGHDIALMAIPEPQTWAMLLGGFGMLIGLQRMRRRSN